MNDQLATIINIAVQVLLVVATISLATFTALMTRATKMVAERTETVSIQTAALAEQTAILVQETINNREMEDRHHQEALLPILMIEAMQVTTNLSGLRLTGKLRNIGSGIAMDVTVSVDGLGLPTRCRPLGVGDADNLEIQVITTSHPRGQSTVLVTVAYGTQFGSPSRTEHFARMHVLGADNIVVTLPVPISR